MMEKEKSDKLKAEQLKDKQTKLQNQMMEEA